jgi:hypothetical protein
LYWLLRKEYPLSGALKEQYNSRNRLHFQLKRSQFERLMKVTAVLRRTLSMKLWRRCQKLWRKRQADRVSSFGFYQNHLKNFLFTLRNLRSYLWIYVMQQFRFCHKVVQILTNTSQPVSFLFFICNAFCYFMPRNDRAFL